MRTLRVALREQVHWLAVGIACVAYLVFLLLFAAPPSHRYRIGREPVPNHHGRKGASSLLTRRRLEVAEMARHAWRGYFAHASGSSADVVRPRSNQTASTDGGRHLTAFEAVDTLVLMGLYHEADQAEETLLTAYSHESPGSSSSFAHPGNPTAAAVLDISHLGKSHLAAMLSMETVLRMAGSIKRASAYLGVAKQIGDVMLQGYDTSTGVPMNSVDVARNTASFAHGGNDRVLLGAAAAGAVELAELANRTGYGKYQNAANGVVDFVRRCRESGWPGNRSLHEPVSSGTEDTDHYGDEAPLTAGVGVHQENMLPENSRTSAPRGLFPSFVNPESGRWSGSVAWDKASSGYYQSLLEGWITGGKRRDDVRLGLYRDAVDGVLETLLRYSASTHMAFLGSQGFGFDAVMDYESCVAPGVFILGVMHGAHEHHPGEAGAIVDEKAVVAAALDLVATCRHLQTAFPAKLPPSQVLFNASDGTYRVADPRYTFQGAAAVSYLYLYRYTLDPRFREWAWELAKAIDTRCRTATGYAVLNDVRDAVSSLADDANPQLLSVTLKAVYLTLADPEYVPLDQFILSEGGHLLPVG